MGAARIFSLSSQAPIYLFVAVIQPGGGGKSMQNFIGVSFFALLFLGIGLILFGGRSPNKTFPSSPRQVVGFFLAGVAFLWCAGANAWFELTLPRPTITGTIGALAQHHGKSSSSTFTVVGDNDERVLIYCYYAGTGLQMGERIRVHYIQFNHHLLDAEILSGSVKGWSFAESDGRWLYVWMGFLGLVLFYAGYRMSRKLPQAS
jgi:hypothetical protein